MSSLKEKTSKGLFWGSINNATTQLLNLAFGIVMARLLTRADYGIVAVLTVFTLVAGCIQAAGFSQALANLKQPTHREYNAVFWFNVLAGSVLYALLFLCAPLIAQFFHQPVLVSVSRFTFLTILISALGIIPNAYLWINLRVREMAIANFWGLIAAGTSGLILAYNGYAYWSLAWQQVVYVVVATLLKYYYARWRPSLRIDMSPVRTMFPFAVKVLITNILNTVNQNVLTFVFGRLFPIATVGVYNQANKWNTLGHTFVSGTINQVAQPVLTAVGNDSERELRVFRKMLRFTSFLAFPAMLGLALIAHEFIILAITSEWEACVPLLQMLCVGGAFLPLHVLFQNMAISHARSDIYLRCSVLQIVVQLVIILLFHRWGIHLMVAACSACNIVYLLVWHLFTRKLSHLTLWQLLKDTTPFALVALTAMAVTYYCTLPITQLWLLLTARIAMAAALYLITLKLLHARILDECLQFARQKLNRK